MKLLASHPTHYHIEGDDGHHFSVITHGLKPSQHLHIQSLAQGGPAQLCPDCEESVVGKPAAQVAENTPDADYKLLDENDASFKLQHPDGREFIVPKKGLSHKMHAKIRKYATGGASAEATPGSSEPTPAPAAPPVEAAPEQSVSELESQTGPVPEGGGAFSKIPAEMQKNYEALEEKPAEEKPLEAAPPPGDRSEAPAKGSLAEQLGITNPNQKIELYGPDGQTKVTTFGEADALLNQGYTLGPATKAPPIPTSVPLKEPGATLAKPPIDVFDTTAEEAAIKERANIEASKAAGEMEIQDKYIKQRETMHDKYFNPETGILTKRNEAADKLFDAAMTGRVDPDAYWRTNPNDPNSDIDTGKKIRAGIGMLISGIGAGLGRTTNLAVAQINNAIDRNIDAQKYNIGQKWNAFKMYGEQTNNVISQMNLMKADMLDVSAAMTLKNAAQFAGPAAMQQAVIASQELRRQASVQRQEATLRDVHLESGILDLDMKRAQHSWMTEMYGGPQTANGTSTTMNDPARRARLIGQGVALGMIKPETLVYDQQDVPITDQNGKVMTDKDGRPQMKTQVVPYVAPDHERAQKADQILEGTRRVISAVNELEQITDRSHLGVWDRTKLGRAQELMLEIATSLERVQAGGGLNRMPSPEIMKAIHDAMGDPTSINTGRTFGALDEIRKRMIEEQRTTRGTLK